MSVSILDAAGSPVSIKSSLAGTDSVLHHVVEASALPVGASTEVTLGLVKSKLDEVASTLGGIASALALVAKEATVSTESTLAAVNNSLTDIKSTLLGQASKLEAQPVTLSSTGHALESTQSSVLSAVQGTLKVKRVSDAGAVSSLTGTISDTSAVQIAAAVSAKKNYLLRIDISNSGGTDSYFEVRSGGTAVWTVFVKAGENFSKNFDRESCPETAVNTAMNVAAMSTTTSRICYCALTE